MCLFYEIVGLSIYLLRLAEAIDTPSRLRDGASTGPRRYFLIMDNLVWYPQAETIHLIWRFMRLSNLFF